jgi:hypothetical protein
MKKRKPIKPLPGKQKAVDIGQVFDDNVRIIAKSSEVALKAYVEIVKSLTDPSLARTGANLVQELAAGWRDALIESTRILRNAYATLDKEIK